MDKFLIFPKWYQWICKRIFLALLPTVILFALQHWIWFIAGAIVKQYPASVFTEPLTPLDKFHITDGNSWFLIFYGLSYVYWLVMPIVIYSIYGPKLYYRFVWTLVFMYLFGGIIFIAFPTSSKILYTDSDFSVTGTDIFSKFIENMRVHNSGVCALPSFHVIGTYSIFLIQRSSLSKKYSKNISKKTNISLLIFSSIFNVMVGMSTFMTHQHFILDFPSAILCCEIVYFIMLKLEKKPNITQRLFTNLNVALAFENAQNTTWGGNLCTKIMNLKHRTFWYVLIIILYLVVNLGLLYSFSIGL